MPAHARTRAYLWILAGIVGIVLADQVIKRIMVAWIGPDASQHRVEVLGAAFAFEYLENRGAAFGWFQQGTVILAAISVIAVIVGLVVIWKTLPGNRALAAAIGLIVAGAAGNAIDRWVLGYVVDYIAIGRFWKFNLADSAVTIGAILAFLLLMQADHATQSPQDNTA